MPSRAAAPGRAHRRLRGALLLRARARAGAGGGPPARATRGATTTPSSATKLDALGRRLGGAYRVLVDANQHVDREGAARAGVGFYGKNTLLITPRARLVGRARHARHRRRDRGDAAARARLRLLPPLHRRLPDGRARRAGRARREPLPLLLDAGAPPDSRSRTARSSGASVYGCDICQDVCPWNRGVEKRRAATAPAGDAAPTVSLVDWLERDGGELVAELDRLYVPRNDPRWLRRNALVALGNTGAAEHAPAAALYVESDDEMLRETRRRGRCERIAGRVLESAAVDDRLALLAHELRSPVAALVAIAETLASDGRDALDDAPDAGCSSSPSRPAATSSGSCSDATPASLRLERVDPAGLVARCRRELPRCERAAIRAEVEPGLPALAATRCGFGRRSRTSSRTRSRTRRGRRGRRLGRRPWRRRRRSRSPTRATASPAARQEAVFEPGVRFADRPGLTVSASRSRARSPRRTAAGSSSSRRPDGARRSGSSCRRRRRGG